MSAVQADVQPHDLNVPLINAFSNPELKQKFPILSSLDIPLVFSGPENMLNPDTIVTCLMNLGQAIEGYIVDEVERTKMLGRVLFSQCLKIDVIGIEQSPDGKAITPYYRWEINSLRLLNGHYDTIRDLNGYQLYNINKRLNNIRLEH